MENTSNDRNSALARHNAFFFSYVINGLLVFQPADRRAMEEFAQSISGVFIFIHVLCSMVNQTSLGANELMTSQSRNS